MNPSKVRGHGPGTIGLDRQATAATRNAEVAGNLQLVINCMSSMVVSCFKSKTSAVCLPLFHKQRKRLKNPTMGSVG